MCGFCGMIGPEDRAGVGRLEEMARALGHRGPDDFGTWQSRLDSAGEARVVALAHTRLSILDLSPAGHQPMSTSDGALTVAYNGEVYNFRELREELRLLGLPFRSDCDTEVVLQAYRAWGLDAFSRLNGMFALAIWDRDRDKLVLARDRLGIKPLYYWVDDDLLVFGSELGALRLHPAFRAEIDRGSLGLFLRHGYVTGERSIYRGVRRLLPGHLLVWEKGAESTRPYWTLPESVEPSKAASFDEAVDVLEELLSDAVRRRMVADVPLGAFLSGGVDSSLVVALMTQHASSPIRSFSIGFDDARYDEAPFAKAVAEHLKTDHTELYVSPREAVGVARELPELFDEPFADSSAIPTVLLSRLTRQHVTVSLSGDGGDELFGGYWQYQKLQRLLPWLRVPRPLRRLVAGTATWLPDGPLRNGLRHLSSQTAADLAYRLVSAFGDDVIQQTCGDEGAEPSRIFFETFHEARVESPVQRAMAADARVYLPDDILTKVDRASMSVALEARVPLLDHRVVQMGLGLPLEWVWKDGQTKAPLRAVLYRHVPRELIERPKQGFGIPIAQLLEPELRAWKERYLAPDRLREEGHLTPAGVGRILREWERQRGTALATQRLWRLLCFQRWYARNHRGEGLD